MPTLSFLVNLLSLNFETDIYQRMNALILALQNISGVLWLVVGISLFPLAYIIGHLFYRQDPKRPDQKGFLRLRQAFLIRKGARGLKEHQFSEALKAEMRAEFCCVEEGECEFPYPDLNDYLSNRGLDHLSDFVTWKDNKSHRSKNYINILKMRLKFHEPLKCSTIIRNEAHVRLASSMWWVSRTLMYCGVFALFVLACIAVMFAFASEANAWVGRFFALDLMKVLADGVFAATCAAFVLGFSYYVRTRIEKFIHYQRQREIVHVLETAYIAFRDKPQILSPPFEMPAGGQSR